MLTNYKCIWLLYSIFIILGSKRIFSGTHELSYTHCQLTVIHLLYILPPCQCHFNRCKYFSRSINVQFDFFFVTLLLLHLAMAMVLRSNLVLSMNLNCLVVEKSQKMIRKVTVEKNIRRLLTKKKKKKFKPHPLFQDRPGYRVRKT